MIGAGQILQFWDGADQTGNGTVDGGTGTWNGGNTNWAVAPGEVGFNAPWLSSVGVFQGTAGTVTVSGTQNFDTLQFNSDGYLLTGGVLGLGVAGGGTINTAAGVTATIGSAIIDGVGTSLTKVGAGTLVAVRRQQLFRRHRDQRRHAAGRQRSASALGTARCSGTSGGTGFTTPSCQRPCSHERGQRRGGWSSRGTGLRRCNRSVGVLWRSAPASTAAGWISRCHSTRPDRGGGGVTLAAAANGAFSPNSELRWRRTLP